MQETAKSIKSSLLPLLRYRDPARAMSWLAAAFGFKSHFVAMGEDGRVKYAQLTFGNGMVVVGPVGASEFDDLMKQPDEIGGAETQSCYFIVDDADAHCARAKAAGAEIVLAINDFDYGGRGYSCRDLEGHIWTFGTYDPWPAEPAPSPSPPPPPPARPLDHGARNRVVFGGLLALVAIGSAAGGWVIAGGRHGPDAGELASEREAPIETGAIDRAAREAAERSASDRAEELQSERRARGLAEEAAKSASGQATREKNAKVRARWAALKARLAATRARRFKEAADRAVDEARGVLVRERAAKEAAERASEKALDELARARRLKDSAEQARAEADARLAAERDARSTAERAADDAREALAKERSARVASERVAQDAPRQSAQAPAAKKAEEPGPAPAAKKPAQRASKPATPLPALIP